MREPNKRWMWYAVVEGDAPSVRIRATRILFVETRYPGMWVCAEKTRHGDNPFFTEWLADNQLDAERLAIERALERARAEHTACIKQISEAETRRRALVFLVDSLESQLLATNALKREAQKHEEG